LKARLIPFKKDHLECMDVRDHERAVLAMTTHLDVLQNSIAVTGIYDGRVVCCGGVLPFANGNAEIWLIPSIYVREYKKVFCKELKDWLFDVRDKLALIRMQSACINDELHTEWMEYLGFTKEGVMAKYHNGMDYAMWGRTWE